MQSASAADLNASQIISSRLLPAANVTPCALSVNFVSPDPGMQTMAGGNLVFTVRFDTDLSGILSPVKKANITSCIPRQQGLFAAAE